MSMDDAEPKKARRHAGGAAAGGGLNFQAAATAIATVYMLSAKPIRWIGTIAHDLITSVESETGTGGDDIKLGLVGGETIEVQVKKGLRATGDLWSALLSIAAEIDKSPTIFGLLAVCPESSGTIRTGLQRDLMAIGDGHSDGVSALGKQWIARLEAAGLNPVTICSRLRIRTISALMADGGDIQAARAELNMVCAQGSVDTAWSLLYKNASELIERRGSNDRASAAAVLRAFPIALLGDLALPLSPPPLEPAKALADLLAGETKPGAGAIPPLSELGRKLLGDEAEARAEHIRKARYFVGFVLDDAARRLAAQLNDGEFAACLPPTKARLLARCARWLSFKGDPEEVEALIAASRLLTPTEEATVASAFLAARSDWKAGLQMLAAIATPYARAAALQIHYNAKGKDDTLAWADQAKIGIDDLDSDGRFLLLSCRLDREQWDRAYADAIQLTEVDLERTPILHYAAGLARLTHSVVADMRVFAANGVPTDARGFPLIDTASAIAERRESARLFGEAARAARTFGSKKAADFNATYSLWLELREPEYNRAARERLGEIFASGEDIVPFIPLALAFGIPIDQEAVEAELTRRMAFEPDGNSDVALARLAIASTICEPKAAAVYFESHAGMMVKHLSPAALLETEIRFLADAERFTRARERLAADGDILSELARDDLERTLERGPGGLETRDFEDAYASSPDTAHLKRLVAHLAAQDFSERFVELGRELVRKTHNRQEAEMMVSALIAHNRHDDIAALLGDVPELIDGSPLLRSSLAWNLFRDGDLGGATAILDALRSERDERDDRSLHTNILILSGRWTELAQFVEEQWAARDKRDAEELIGAAQLAHQIGSPRAAELMQFAAAKGSDDARVLITSYSLATQMGRENDLGAFAWFEAAAALSGEDGPVKRMTLADVAARAPDWSEQVEHANNIWRRGEAPLPLVAEALRQPSLELLLTPIIANPDQTDPRRRSIISAFSGVRGERKAIGEGPIGLDGSALVTLAKLGRLDAVLAHPRGVILPHSTLSWLFLERQDLPFHQPSRIAAAHYLMRLVVDGKLHPFAPQGAVDAGLGDLVGRTLAAMLTEARTIGDSERPRYVIRSAKVTRVGSFLDEPVDLGAHAAALRSCQALLDALVLRGVVTEAEETAARRYLERAEERWPAEEPIAAKADLYLDDLSVSYLRTTGLLGKLAPGGFRAFLSDHELATSKALIEAERRGAEMEAFVEGLGKTLSDALAAGKVRLDRWFAEDGVKAHPNIAILQLVTKAVVVVSDDRYINQYRQIDDPKVDTPIWSTLDLLAAFVDEGLLSQEDLWADRTALRQYGYVLIPTDRHEIEYHLAKCPVVDGELVENAAAKALRENIRLAQQRGWLVLMRESPWVLKLLADFGAAIHSQWADDISDDVARARSRWLLAGADLRNWAGCLEGDQTNIARYGMAIPYARMLMNRVNPASDEAVERMDAWLEELLDALRQEQPDIHDWLIEHVRIAIAVHARDALDGE